MEADWPVSQEEAAEVDPVDLVEHGVEAGDLTDVIADDVEQAARYVRLTELSLILIDPGTAQLEW